MYKIIACDLDETLLQTWDKKVSQRNREAIAKARERGVKFVVATGRGYMTVQGTLDEVGVRGMKDQYVICFNGGAITENENNEIIYFHGIHHDEAEALFAAGMRYDVGMHVYTKDTVYVWGFDKFGERDFLNGRMEVVEREDTDLSFLAGEDIVKCLYVNTDFAYLNKVKEEIADLTERMDVSFSSNRYIEFNRKGVNKGAGLRRLAEVLGVDIADTIAIGDNFNDLPMIREAGLGVGVANAAEGIRGECDFITENDCDHDAVAEVIEKFILNEK